MIDNHTHLDLIDDELESLINRAKAVGVTGFVVPGVSGFPNKLSQLIKYPEIKIGWGIYPKFADEEGLFETKLKELHESKIKVSLIGECGLDKRLPNIEKQIELFSKHIKLGIEMNLPLIIHLVGCYNLAYNLLARSNTSFILHSWTGSAQMAKEFVKIGGKISLSASILKSPKKLKELFLKIDEDRIIFETDSPYQKPCFWEKAFNEPAALPSIIKAIKTCF